MSFIPSIVQFWLYFIILIPSILCTLFLLYLLLFDRNLRHALKNHVIIVLLITVLLSEITIYPWMLYYDYQTDIWQRTPVFCSIWGYIDGTFYYMQVILFAWASIERHILIFHGRWLATRRKRLFLHYLPITCIVVYCLIFYSAIYFFPPCENTFDSVPLLCIVTCLSDSAGFSIYETVANNVLPSTMIVILSVTLLVRVFRQKRRIRQAMQWRKHRKMTIQLVSIALLYLLITCPYAIIRFSRLCGLSDDQGAYIDDYTVFVSYFIVLLFPFVAILSVPEFVTKLKKIFRLHRRKRSIAAAILPMNNLQQRN